MANTNLTASIIAAEAVTILENQCVMGNLVYRGYEQEFAQDINGYTVGQTINVRRPADFTIRTGRTASVQDVVEGQFPIVVNTQVGVDFQFSAQELTQNIRTLSERAIRPAMIQIANKIDADLCALATFSNNWVGTPGNLIGPFASLGRVAERMDLLGVPQDSRAIVVGPSDFWSVASSATALYMQQVAQDSYRNGRIGMLANIDTYMSQNVLSFARGTATTCTLNSLFTASYTATLNSNTQSLAFSFLTSQSINAGDVFTMSSVYAVNSVTKAQLNYLQQFVVVAAVGGTATVTATITPPIITSGAFQTCSAAPTASTAVTFLGTASLNYTQNLGFQKNALVLCMVPLVKPPGAVDVSRQTYKGYSVRVIPYYSGTNDISSWRLDVLYGVKCLDPRAVVRASG